MKAIVHRVGCFLSRLSDDEFEDLMFAIVASAALILVVTMGGCAAPVYSDPGPPATDSGDLTALIAGCGRAEPQASLYCRFPVGWRPAGNFYVVVPPTACPGPYCATVTVFMPDASQAAEKPVPKGQAWVAIPWSALLGTEPLTKDRRGFWPILVKWSWTDPDTGVIMAAASEGELRLRVYSAAYTPLDYNPDEQTWTWSVNGKSYGATDKGRAVVAPSGMK